jgi:hypothetical protein
MRPEFDSEIDSVLRGHARRGGASPVAWEAGVRPSISDSSASVSHLDADEIAAFGEGALPPAARSRYSAHLADCDDCRRSVTQVALAAGVAGRVEERERGVAAAAALTAATQSPSWRERLAALFAPRAWRYAMPVVALVAVSAVVLVVTSRLPREGASETAARRGNAEQRQVSAPAAAPEAHHSDATRPQPSAQPGTLAANTATTGVAPVTGEDEYSAAGELAKLRPKTVEGADQAVGGTAGTAGAQPEAAKQIQAEHAPPPAAPNYSISATPSPVPLPPAPRAAVLRDMAMATPTPPPPAPTPAPAQADEIERARSDSRAAAAPRDEASATKRHGPQRGGRAMAGLSANAPSKDDRVTAARRARGPAKAETNRNEAEDRKAKEAKAQREEDREQQRGETRTVGGRRFRREGNVWIDTAYRSSQATVTVRRDSEQYRALVADEPEIGRISRALGGEAVIVWKGRAYRVKP